MWRYCVQSHSDRALLDALTACLLGLVQNRLPDFIERQLRRLSRSLALATNVMRLKRETRNHSANVTPIHTGGPGRGAGGDVGGQGPQFNHHHHHHPSTSIQSPPSPPPSHPPLFELFKNVTPIHTGGPGRGACGDGGGDEVGPGGGPQHSHSDHPSTSNQSPPPPPPPPPIRYNSSA